MSNLKENTEEKSMVKINENNIFYKIKTFFRNIFRKNIKNENNIMEESKTINQENSKSSFLGDIRSIENEETKLLKLQKQYRKGDVKEEDMTKEQISSLIALYDKQITNLKKSNEIRKQKLLEYRKNMKVNS